MISLFKVRMAYEASEEVGRVLHSGFIGEGPKVKEFEQRIREVLALHKKDYMKPVVVTNSATSAEHLAYRLLQNTNDLFPGDEVLATPLTCTATNWPILANNLHIKWVDIDPTTMNMDLDDLARKITPKTKAISIVHWGGYPLDMDRIDKIRWLAEERMGVFPALIQDCAHALGSTLHGKPLTQWGDFATYSFQAVKHLTCGDGGALVSSYTQWDKQARLLRWYGIDRDGPRTDFRCENDIPEWGYKFNMNDISATIGLANLSLLDDTLKTHGNNAAFYNATLWNVGGIKLLKNEVGFNSACWLYTMRVDNRDGFITMMKDKGIQVSRVHDRNDKHSCVKQYRTLLPNVEEVSRDMICIPVGWWVTEENRRYIADCIKEGW